jgi:hypothetical protein
MESRLRCGLIGIGIPDCTWKARAWRGDSVLESASLADSAGDGVTGDSTGITTTSFSIITVTYLTAEFSQIASTSTREADFVEQTDFTVEAHEDSLAASMDSPRHTLRVVCIPAHSAALIMEEQPGAFLHAASPASVVVSAEARDFMAAEASTAEAVTGNSFSIRQSKLKIWRKKLCARTI